MEIQKRLSKYGELFFLDDKAAAVDMLAEQFYERNFGRMTKSDFEMLMFHLYIERCLKTGKPFDDYTLSRDLGITQSRVRALKVKKELQYPHKEFEWKQSFVECISHAHYDKVKKLVKVHIPDVNVLLELRNHIEKQGWYDEYQLNPKLFQCNLDVFVALCQSLSENDSPMLDEDARRNLKNIQREAKSEDAHNALDKILRGDLKEGLKELALTAGEEMLMHVIQKIPFVDKAKDAFDALSKLINRG